MDPDEFTRQIDAVKHELGGKIDALSGRVDDLGQRVDYINGYKPDLRALAGMRPAVEELVTDLRGKTAYLQYLAVEHQRREIFRQELRRITRWDRWQGKLIRAGLAVAATAAIWVLVQGFLHAPDILHP